MATLTIRGNTFTPRSPSVSIVGQVNAEQVTFVVDESWNGLELQAQFSNASIDREPIPVALDETMTCFVPSEATAQPGKVYVALAGYDDGVQIKLTELLHYSNAKAGADPNGGVPPEEQTPSYLNQITQILSETKAVAQSVRDDADQGKFDGEPGKNGEPGKSPKEEGGTWWLWNEEKQKWIDTGILAAGKNGISPKVATQPVTGGTRVIITDADGEKSFDVLNGKNGNPGKNGETPNITIGRVDTLPSGSKATAEITGQTPRLTLNMGIPQGREGPSGLGLPTPTPEDAGKVLMVNPEGDGYIFGEAGGGKIDDTKLGRDTTWSSLKIVDSLAPKFESSGPVVTCNPVPGYPLSVVSKIVPVQDGAGEPSPDNVRPIVGWERANLWIGGKNLLSLLDYTNIKNGPIVNENEIIFSKNLGVVDYVFQNMKPGQYTVSFKRSGYGGIEVTVGGKKVIANGGSSMYKGTFTVAMDEVVTISLSEGQNPNKEQRIVSDVMLTFGGHVEYERYKQGSDVKSMSFGQTVYGGVLDWISGVLTITKEKVILNGSEDWSYDQSFNGYSTAKETKYKDAFLPLCNIAKGVISNQTTGHTIRADYGAFRFQGFADSYPDLGSFKAFLQSQNAEIICELTEPFMVQLTPTEILALSGVNTLYTNTGDTTVVGRADPDATIKGLLSRIDALEKAAIGGV